MNTASIKKTGLGVLIGVLLMIGVQSVSAWTAPTNPPVGGNVVAPVNTGIFGQTKTSWIAATDFLASNHVESPRGFFGQGILNPNFNPSNSPYGATSLWAMDFGLGKGISVDNSGNFQIKISNNPAAPGAQGVGKVLTSDASGYATWQPATGGLPVGLINETLRHDGASWTSAGFAGLKNDGARLFQGLQDVSVVDPSGYPVGNAGEVVVDDPFYVSNNVGVKSKVRVFGDSNTDAVNLEVTGKVKITDGTQGVGKVLTSDAAGAGSWGYAIPDIVMKEGRYQFGSDATSMTLSCPDHYAAISVSCDADTDNGVDQCMLTDTNYSPGPIWSPDGTFNWKQSASSGKYTGGIISPSDGGSHNGSTWANMVVTCMRYEQ